MENKICPQCNTDNPKAANYCRKCRYHFSNESKEGFSLKPIFKYVRIQEEHFVVGSKIHIEWDADNYKRIELSGEDVTLYKNIELIVEKAMQLDLIATNDFDQTTEIIKVVPDLLPVIRSFTTSHFNIMSGKFTKLSWKVDNASRIILKTQDEELDVTLLKEFEVCPKEDTTYTLEAQSVDKEIAVKEHITINVHKEIIIKYFKSNIPQTLETQPVELKWVVENANKIILYPNDIDVTEQNSIIVYPNRSTIYHLYATNSLSTKEEFVSIGVQPLPKLDVKVSESLSRLTISSCDIDFSQFTRTIREANLDKWFLSPTDISVTRKIFRLDLWSKMMKKLAKSFKINL